MSPVIISDSHEKPPLGKEALREFEVDKVVAQSNVSDFGPDNLEVRFSLLEGEDSGTVAVEIMENGEATEVVGNIDFVKLDAEGTCLENGVQIRSAYFNSDYRGQGLGISAYEMIARQYLLVSDNTQTHDGSAFWKYKIGDNDNLEVHIVVQPVDGQPFKVLDEDDVPVVYHYLKEELESMIWGLKLPTDAPHPDIDASEFLTREDVVLVAVLRT